MNGPRGQKAEAGGREAARRQPGAAASDTVGAATARWPDTAASASGSARPGALHHYVDTTAREALAPQDAVLLGQLCLVLDKRDAAFEAMEAGGGLVVPAPTNGMPMPNQHYVVWRQLCGEAAKLAAQLCLTLPNGAACLPDLRCVSRTTSGAFERRHAGTRGFRPKYCPDGRRALVALSPPVPTTPDAMGTEKPLFSGLSPVSPLSPPESRNHSADPLAKSKPVDQAPSA